MENDAHAQAQNQIIDDHFKEQDRAEIVDDHFREMDEAQSQVSEKGSNPEAQRLVGEVDKLRGLANNAEQQPSWDNATRSQRSYVEQLRANAASLEQAANFLIREGARMTATTPEVFTQPTQSPQQEQDPSSIANL